MRILAVVLLAGALAAQTRVTPDSLSGTPGANPRVWVVLPNGTLAEAELENIQLVIVNGKPVLRAAANPLPVVSRTKHVLTAARTDFPLLPGATLDAVYRNGLLQAADDDYTVTAGVVRFKLTLAVGDIVQIRELR